MSRMPTITVNGTPRALAGTRVHASLLDFLRDTGSTGAKEGCAEGECGACSVMVARPDGPDVQRRRARSGRRSTRAWCRLRRTTGRRS